MKKLIVTGILTLNAIAFAAPAEVYDGRIVTAAGTNSPILRDTQDPNKIYVLPPREGYLIKRTEDLAVTKPQCDTIAIYQKGAKQLAETLVSLETQQGNIMLALTSDLDMDLEKEAKLRARFDANLEHMNKLEANLRAKYELIGADSGGYLHLEYATPWTENTEKIRKYNHQYQVVQLEGRNLKIAMNIPALGKSKAPIYSDFSVNGENQGALSAATTQTTSKDLKVDIALTTLGACYFKYPALFGTDLEAKFGLTTTYDIARSFSFDINASIDYWQVYTYLHEQGTSGGFFTSSSWSNTVQTTMGESAFKIHWETEDPEDKISSIDQIKIESEIKVRLLADLASIITGKLQVDLNQAAGPGENGAKALSAGLEKIPDPDAQAAALALKVLDAIFGSSSSSTSFQSKIKGKVSENFSSKTARYVKYSTVY